MMLHNRSKSDTQRKLTHSCDLRSLVADDCRTRPRSEIGQRSDAMNPVGIYKGQRGWDVELIMVRSARPHLRVYVCCTHTLARARTRAHLNTWT